MKTLIYQNIVNEPDLQENKRLLFDTAATTVERYANNIGSEYLLSREKYFPNYHSIWGIFRILKDPMFKQYDKVMFVDGDVFARNTDNNIFKKYHSFAACRNTENDRSHMRPEYKLFGPRFFNSGVVIFNPEDIDKLSKNNPDKYMKEYQNVKPGRDQLALNVMAHQILGPYIEIMKRDACYLKDESESMTAPLVHLAGRDRQKYWNNIDFWNEQFEV